MKVYLDVCAIQRPLDTRSHLRVVLEAEAILEILALCRNGDIALMASDAHAFEIGRTPHPMRKRYALEVMALAAEHVVAGAAVRQRAERLNAEGFKALDALHLALAIEAGADYFCTCDDRLLSKARRIDTGSSKVVSPLELIEEVDK